MGETLIEGSPRGLILEKRFLLFVTVEQYGLHSRNVAVKLRDLRNIVDAIV